MRRPVIAGNWKMNILPSELEAYFSAYASTVSEQCADFVDKVVAPPTSHLFIAQSIASKLGVIISSQNVHWEDSGAFTGEVSSKMLLDLGIQYAIIGHSERRQFFGETNRTVGGRVANAMKANLIPIICIGETEEERESGLTEKILVGQLESFLNECEGQGDFIIAYEPVWAIGTGKSATAETAQETHELIRSKLSETLGRNVADRTRILYGGSVKPSNLKEYLEQNDIDGGLVGGASLKGDTFAQMVNIAGEGLLN